VFSFGIFMLEVTCRRRPLVSFAADDQNVLFD
jgi:hypothetical protein